MRRIVILFVAMIMLSGCSGKGNDLQYAKDLRSKLQSADALSFEAQITADYGKEIYTFLLKCEAVQQGDIHFEVLEPESISGIAGKISGESGEITFDDKVLAFNTLADGYISPVSSPWVMINSLKSGYITSCGQAEDDYRISLNDSYADDALQLDVWVDSKGDLKQCDIFYKERRCLTIVVKNFTYL